MALKNYWWLILWMFTGGIALAKLFPKRYEYVHGKRELRWNILPAILLVVPYIIWAGFREDGFYDTGTYRMLFNIAPSSFGELPAYMATINKDKGFYLLSACMKIIFGDSDVLYFLILATVQMLIIALVFRKYSCNYWMSIFVFIASTEYMSYAHNGLRQFMAVTIILAATPFMVRKKYVPLILLIILAGTMHGSAFLMLPIIFIVQGKAWNKRTLFCLICTAVAIVFVDQFTNLLDGALVNTQYSNMVTDWTEWEDDGTNPIRVFIYCIPMLMSILGMKVIKKLDDPVINMLTNYSIIAAAFALISMVTSGIFMGRLIIYGSIYASTLLLPWLIERLFTLSSIKFIYGMMIMGYVCLFYYQMYIVWELF